jgi:hypothetical protein
MFTCRSDGGHLGISARPYQSPFLFGALSQLTFAPAGHTIEVTPVMLDSVLNALRA